MDQPDNTSQHLARHHQRGRGRGRQRPTREHGEHASGVDPASTPPTHDAERPPRRPQRRPLQPTDEPAPSTSTTLASHPPPRPSRRGKFKATLTEAPAEAQTSTAPPPTALAEKPKPKPRPRRARELPPSDDLTSTLTHALRIPPFPDCSICFSPIRPENPTWSCSPPASTGAEPDKDTEGSQYCWNTFHLRCIRAWAEKSVRDLEEAWQARGESRPGEWRCPGCRATRQAVPHTYMCFCLRMRHPAPPRIATPHSCAQPCSRPRSTCRHPCPLPCHPGPCPPCAVTIQVACFCGKERHSAKCQVGMTALSFSCAQPCRKPLRCGNSEHRCAEACHEGLCPPCPGREEVRCWCGRQTKYVACGEVKVEDSTRCVVVKDDGSERVWMGSYGCGHPCERPFACSHHSCSKPCHVPSRMPPPCPFDPERIVSCACGRCRIARSSDELAASSTRSSAPVLPPRTSCTSPLPTCTSPCSKPLPCGHLCQATCHWDPCPPCTEQVERTCRCGATKHKTPCGDAVLAPIAYHPTDGSTPASEDITCDKPCQAFRSCGRHQCGRICCPLAPLAPLQRATKSSKRRDALHTELDAQLDPAMRALHECDLPCGRVLVCGNHRCPQRDHKGPCAVCPRGVFEELVCLCGRTVLEPPIQCGTRLRCVYPCARPAPACGHPHVPHACHEGVVVAEGEDGGACPPCPFLTEKVCACGKKRVGNVRCSQERVSCGSVCGKLLACGFHHCERLCHAEACGTCTAVCGKSRKSWYVAMTPFVRSACTLTSPSRFTFFFSLPAHHPCTQICHAPTSCPETEPCLTPVTLTCPCGHLRSTVPCSGTKLTLACTGECEIRKRNARLAEALGISEEKRESRGRVTWSTELVGCARGLGPKFVGVVEKAFADFVTSDRRTQVLPHMPPERRKFVHDLASVYRMDTVMVDQEPHRSVQLIRRIDTRVPVPLLSQHVTSTGPTMGQLVDLRVGGKGVGAGAGTGTGTGTGSSAWGVGTSGASGGAGAGTGTGTGTGTGKWNAVAKSALGALRSGSVTPARVPSPAGEAVRSREVSPGASTGGGASGGTKGGVWVSPSVRAQRERESATVAGAAPVPGATFEVEDVPDDWEDDV
ncbi:hypothetical protein J3R83DRAFT_10664 [Lanmaoa asiatica]|nr:hypothetical protein J3R83DRAFT_10664 [Lanmaoa asiatica]